MKYQCYHEFDEHDCLEWHVYENATQQIIATFLFEDDAMEYMRKLESGYGFQGFTPSFMLVRPPKMDINTAFTAEFV